MRMQGASRDSLAAAQDRLDALTSSGAVDALRLGEELFAVVGVLDREHALRRALSDPALPGEQRAALLDAVLGARVSGESRDLLGGMARERWSRPGDLVEAIELMGVQAEVVAAEQEGRLDELEDELFRFGRIVAAQPELRTTLGNRAVPAERRVELLRSLLQGRASESTLRLVSQLVRRPAGRTLDRGLEDYAAIAAARRERLVAHVRAAVPLTEQQRERLGAALARTYGHAVHLNIEVDPSVVGGISVRIGDEVIDGTVVSRLDTARRRLAG